MDDKELRKLLENINDAIRYGDSRDGSNLTQEAIDNRIESTINAAIKEFKNKLIEAEKQQWRERGKSEKEIEKHIKSKRFQKRIERETEAARPDIEEKSKKEVRRKTKEEAWNNLGGRSAYKLSGMGKDVSRFGNSLSAISGNKGAISKAGVGIAKLGGALTKFAGPLGIAVEVLDFAISKASEYSKLHSENLMKEMNAVNTAVTNEMKSNLSSWQNVVEGAYNAQQTNLATQQAIMEAQNSIELANLKMAHTWTNWIPIWGELNKAKETELEMEQQLNQTRLKNAADIIAQVNEYTQRTDKYINEQDKAIHRFQMLNGMSADQTKAFEDRLLAQGEAFAKFNKTIDDALKLQTNVQETSGRTINYSNEDYENTFAVGRLVGEENLTNFQSHMQLFNHSVSDSADIMYKMYNDVNKMGLSQAKVTKTVLANMKLAEKYSFKNGTKGLIEMAKWAENVRFNMGTLGNMIEKSQSGGLEGTITQAAKLQVLGGNFAMGADPIAMAYEALNDPDAYAKRAHGMLKGIGVVDNTTGETTINGADTLRLRAYADAMGMSVEDARNMVREENKKTVVKRQMSNSSLSSDQLDAVANKAQRDEKTGKWYVNTINGGKIDVNNVTQEDIANILSDNKNEAAVQYAKSTMSLVEQIEASTKAIDAKLGNLTFENYAETVKNNTNVTQEAFSKAAVEIKAAIETDRSAASAKQREILSKLTTINTSLNTAFDTVKENEKRLEDEQKRMQEHLDNVRKERAETHTKTTNRWETLGKSYAKARDEDYNYFKNFSDSQEIATDRAKYYSAMADEKKANGNYGGYAIDKLNAFTVQTVGRGLHAIGNVFGLKGNWIDDYIHDGYANTNNNVPMAVAASSVTPIHDGAVARTDPQDHAIFAKVGGPFDTLFNGIFKKINRIYGEMFEDNSTHESYMPTAVLHWDNRTDNFMPTNHSASSNYASHRMLWNVRNNVGDSFANDNSIRSFAYPQTTLSSLGIVRNGDNTQWFSTSNANRNTTYANSRLHWDNRTDNFMPTNHSASSNYANIMRLGNVSNPNGSVAPKPYDPFKGLAVLENDFGNYYAQRNASEQHNNKPSASDNKPIKFEPITLNINIDGSLGRSSTFLEELQNDMTFRRSLIQIISKELSAKANGGRPFENGRYISL